MRATRWQSMPSQPPTVPPCPKCGRRIAKLADSHDVYPPLAPPIGEPKGTTYTYECPCGVAFAVNVKNDAWKPTGPA